LIREERAVADEASKETQDRDHDGQFSALARWRYSPRSCSVLLALIVYFKGKAAITG